MAGTAIVYFVGSLMFMICLLSQFHGGIAVPVAPTSYRNTVRAVYRHIQCVYLVHLLGM